MDIIGYTLAACGIEGGTIILSTLIAINIEKRRIYDYLKDKNITINSSLQTKINEMIEDISEKKNMDLFEKIMFFLPIVNMLWTAIDSEIIAHKLKNSKEFQNLVTKEATVLPNSDEDLEEDQIQCLSTEYMYPTRENEIIRSRKRR